MFWKIVTRILLGRTDPDSSFETVHNDGTYLSQNGHDGTVTWVGHATLLVQIEGVNFLTDPIWSERCSPVSFAGPKRFVKPGIEFDALPRIDFVLISHDHYDHLDAATIKNLAKLGVRFFVPIGVGQHLADWGIDQLTELDWWEEARFGGLTITCTPAQHFSGRTPFDRNRTLWSGWAVTGEHTNVFFAGDTGYFPGFAEIGKRLGPFDLAALPIGAYNYELITWRMVHLNPEDAIRAFLDLGAEHFVPIHWGTFRLAFHPDHEPAQRLSREITRLNLKSERFLILKHGETRVWKTHDTSVP